MTAFLEVALIAALVGGFAGGLHCAGMCGGIVHALCAGGDGIPKRKFAYLLAYNAGRIASYACAGALAGAVGEAGLLTRAAPVLQPVFFALASVMLVALGLYLAGASPLLARLEAAGSRLWAGVQPLTRHLLPVDSVFRAVGLGALWGWLPCGMVYAVLLTALALASGWQGALLMLAFGIGTLPNLMGLGFVAGSLGALRRRRIGRIFAGSMIAAFGVYSLAGIAHSTPVGGGVLCHIVPGLDRLLH
jgi:uncharacterized protein